VTLANPVTAGRLKKAIREEASRLGFTLAGFTTPDPPPHLTVFEDWLTHGNHAGMAYMANESSRARRANPGRIMLDCRTVLVLAAPYSDPASLPSMSPIGSCQPAGRIAAYAWGQDYHLVFPARLQEVVRYIEREVGHPVASRSYTDTGPILERDLAQRAGLGWIGKNSCLINPKQGSYFLLAEILLDLELEPDPPFATDHCGSCTRCIEACTTACILPGRTLDAGRCISYLTIELRDEIPVELRSRMGTWVFGCDVCQMVCPWNRFARPKGDDAFRSRPGLAQPQLMQEIGLDAEEFIRKFRQSPIKRATRRGYRRNIAVALGNTSRADALLVLQNAIQDSDALLREHADWAIQQISHPNRTSA
jgi:epoxyqueuosine reductase